jgi:hypothetical protein
MRQQKTETTTTQRMIRVGGLYLDLVRSILVTVEDPEAREGRRTGRVLVCSADDRIRYPLRWYCQEADLVEAEILASGKGRAGEVLS